MGTRWQLLFQRRNTSGFTLLELLIASAVLTIGMLSTASLLLVALSSHFSSKLEAAALRMTQSTLEELKSLPLNHAGLADSTDSLTPGHEIDFSAPSSPSHARTTMVTLQSFGSTRIEFETRLARPDLRRSQSDHRRHPQDRRPLPLPPGQHAHRKALHRSLVGDLTGSP